MKLIEFITFVVCTSALLSCLGILFSAFLLCLREARAGQLAVLPASMGRLVARLAEVRTLRLTRAASTAIAFSAAGIFVFVGVTASVIWTEIPNVRDEVIGLVL